MMHEAQEIGVEHLTRVNKERFPVFEKIIEDDNRQFAEVIMPAYRKMLELFTSKMHLAEFSTIQHFTALLEFVEIWNRWLDSSIPPEVVTNIGHTETKLYPFYEDLESNFVIMQRALTGKRRWWKRSHAPVLKVLPSQ